MDSLNSLKDHIDQLFINPCFEQLFEQYPEKCLENLIIVQLIVEMIQNSLYYKIIQLIDPRRKQDKTDLVINSAEQLYLIWNENLDISKFHTPVDKGVIRGYCRGKFQSLVRNYYGDNPNKQFNKNYDIEEIFDLGVRYICRDDDDIAHILSMIWNKYRKYMDLPVNDPPSRVDFSYGDFSGMNFEGKIFCCTVKYSNFKYSRFCGDGTTGTCMHIIANNCDFTNAIFNGEICCKTSIFDHSNLTNVNLTALLFNCSEVTMKSCNFTNSYVIDKGKKLLGKDLLRHLDNKGIDIEDSYYDEPKDGGYNKNELNPEVWHQMPDLAKIERKSEK